MTHVCLVTPAHGRHELTDICLAQKRVMADELAREKITVTCVIIAHDDNLDIARHHGFDTIEHPNGRLGERFNLGIRHALELGADFILPSGSDDWVHPDYLVGLNPDGPIRTARSVWIVNETGHKITHLRLTYEGGAGCRVYPSRLFTATRDREWADPWRPRGIDTSILTNLTARNGGQSLRFSYTDDPDLIAAFKTGGAQLNPYDAARQQFGIREYTQPFERLGQVYPTGIVRRLHAYYGHAAPAGTRKGRKAA